MKKINIMYIINAILLVGIIAVDIVYMTVGGGLWVKGTASGLFLITGIINMIYIIVSKKALNKFAVVMTVGLFFAFLGDIIINIEFIFGAALFAVGHIFFFVSYCFIEKFTAKDLIYGAAIFVPSLLIITLVPIFKFDILMEMVCIVYALIISFMVGKSISNYVRAKSLFTLIILIGSILFFFSDFMLLFDVFAETAFRKVFSTLCLSTYYPAEFLLAFSILKSSKE